MDVDELLKLAFAKAKQQMNCVHEFACRQQMLSHNIYCCRKCGVPMDDVDDTF